MHLLPLLLMVILSTSSAHAELIEYPPGEIIVPEQVTDNDDVTLLLTGTYPDSCYTDGSVTVTVDKNAGQILIKNQAWHEADRMCLFQVQPFTKRLNLGKLSPGTYQLDLSHRAVNLLVEATRPQMSAESFPFIDTVGVEQMENNTIQITLTGQLKDDCSKLGNIRIEPVNTDTIEIKPIEIRESRGHCAQVLVPFSRTFSIANEQKTLSQVRVHTRNGSITTRIP